MCSLCPSCGLLCHHCISTGKLTVVLQCGYVVGLLGFFFGDEVTEVNALSIHLNPRTPLVIAGVPLNDLTPCYAVYAHHSIVIVLRGVCYAQIIAPIVHGVMIFVVNCNAGLYT